jgi:hypothetical protein
MSAAFPPDDDRPQIVLASRMDFYEVSCCALPIDLLPSAWPTFHARFCAASVKAAMDQFILPENVPIIGSSKIRRVAVQPNFLASFC